MRVDIFRKLALAGAVAMLATQARAADAPAPKPSLDKVGHIIVLYLENRSFDNLYGLFPGANGIANAGDTQVQTDLDGKVYDVLPPVMNTNLRPAIVDSRFPANLPNKPFRADAYAGVEQTAGDLVHRFYQQQAQIDGGKMDRFAAISDGKGLSMSYYDGSKLPLWDYAKRYVLMDNFFHAAFGGSFLNHVWLICACSPRYEDAPEKLKAKLGEDGSLLTDGVVTPDGVAVNTIQSAFSPHSAKITDNALLLPAQDMPTIGDRLTRQGIDWAWYSGGWNDAVAGKPDALFQFHHQPFAYFRSYGDGTPGREAHLKDGVDFLQAISKGTLPPVAFYKPIGVQNEHPGYASILAGDQHAAEVIKLIERSPLWKDSVIIVTYDENGGYWDHVAPPKGDRWGPAMRIPTLLISPLAKKGFIDSTFHDTTSILKLIETRFGLEPLTERDAAAGDLTETLDLQ
jgi:phospholipase C